jgi:hypothetical protein
LTTIEELRDVASEKRANWTLEETETRCRGAWSKRETLQRTQASNHLLGVVLSPNARTHIKRNKTPEPPALITAIPCRSFDIALAVTVHYDYNHHTFTVTGPTLLACSYSTVYNFRFLVPSNNFNKSISGKRRSMPLEGSLHRIRLNRLSDQPRAASPKFKS